MYSIINVIVSDKTFEKAKRKRDKDNSYRRTLCVENAICPICGENMDRIFDGKEKLVCPVHGVIGTKIY